MTEDDARRILQDFIQPDNSLYCLGHYLCWPNYKGTVTLDDDYTVEELDAIVWWVRNAPLKKKES